MNVVIFSKNRACQLDMLLKSLKHFFVEWGNLNVNIVFKATTPDFDAGYKKTYERNPEFKFIREMNFKADVCGCSFINPLTMFLVDDNIFINYITLRNEQFSFLTDPNVTCISLRMNPRINSCYTQQQRKVKIPSLDKDLKWNWREAAANDLFHGYPSDWGYPMSVDGHIFRTNDIARYVYSLSYNSPNMFEGHLANQAIPGNKMVCFNKSILFNNPVNKVQTINGNQAGLVINASAEEINHRFLGGEILDFEPYKDIEIKTPHQEEPLYFKKEK